MNRPRIPKLIRSFRLRLKKSGQANAIDGSFSNSGVILGDVHIGKSVSETSAAPASSAGNVRGGASGYLEQVRRIAPPQLLGRDAELAALADFCNSSDSSTLRIVAPAWSGKSGLLSWFVLNPPIGIRAISFFITARFAGASDRRAFLESVGSQLSALLGETRPVESTEFSQEWQMLADLKRAIEKCASHGERLVLVVDGLDEDSGITHDGSKNSIASLIPDGRLYDLKVIVSSRPNPPIPIDVSPDHPLRDGSNTQILTTSSYAAARKSDLLREIKRIFYGAQTPRNILGCIVASGGGLGCSDISHILGIPEWEVQNHLESSFGRIFIRVRPQIESDVDQTVFVLAHEELMVEAKRAMASEIDVFRNRIYDWAMQFSSASWPEATPVYLLTGFYWMLHEDNQHEQMLALACSKPRHARLLAVTGGDSLALEEIRGLRYILLNQESAHIEALSRLAMHEAVFRFQYYYASKRTPEAWFRLGDSYRSLNLARAFPHTDDRAEALLTVAHVLAEWSRNDEAISILEEAEQDFRNGPGNRLFRLAAVGELYAKLGNKMRAREIANELLNGMSSDSEDYDFAAKFYYAMKIYENMDDLDEASRQFDCLVEAVFGMSVAHTQLQNINHVLKGAAAKGDWELWQRGIDLVLAAPPTDNFMGIDNRINLVLVRAYMDIRDIESALKWTRMTDDDDERMWCVLHLADALDAETNGALKDDLLEEACQFLTHEKNIGRFDEHVVYLAEQIATSRDTIELDKLIGTIEFPALRVDALAAIAISLSKQPDRLDEARKYVLYAGEEARATSSIFEEADIYVAFAGQLTQAEHFGLRRNFVRRAFDAAAGPQSKYQFDSTLTSVMHAALDSECLDILEQFMRQFGPDENKGWVTINLGLYYAFRGEADSALNEVEWVITWLNTKTPSVRDAMYWNLVTDCLQEIGADSILERIEPQVNQFVEQVLPSVITPIVYGEVSVLLVRRGNLDRAIEVARGSLTQSCLEELVKYLLEDDRYLDAQSILRHLTNPNELAKALLDFATFSVRNSDLEICRAWVRRAIEVGTSGESSSRDEILLRAIDIYCSVGDLDAAKATQNLLSDASNRIRASYRMTRREIDANRDRVLVEALGHLEFEELISIIGGYSTTLVVKLAEEFIEISNGTSGS